MKNWHFSKGVNALFWSKNGYFSKIFFLGNIVEENLFDHIVDQKNLFIRYENKMMKNSKNWHFSKGVNPWFWSKNGNFQLFFLGNIVQKNLIDDILERKSVFLSYKNKKFKQLKNWHFSNFFVLVQKLTFLQNFFFWQYRPEKCLWRYSRAKKRLSKL